MLNGTIVLNTKYNILQLMVFELCDISTYGIFLNIVARRSLKFKYFKIETPIYIVGYIIQKSI